MVDKVFNLILLDALVIIHFYKKISYIFYISDFRRYSLGI